MRAVTFKSNLQRWRKYRASYDKLS